MRPQAQAALGLALALGLTFGAAGWLDAAAPDLQSELQNKGWIVFSDRSKAGDWDLFLVRPDGSDRKFLTRTPGFNEAGARFSPDGQRLLYYRMPESEAVDNNNYGTFELIVANPDGTDSQVLGKDFSWASWGPDSKKIATLSTKGIRIVDVSSGVVIREFPRRGIVQQLVWSPDGKRFVGTANGLGPFWNIAVLDPDTALVSAVSETERYNCTPDWCPDSRRVLYARGIIPNQGGRAELWVASTDGKERQKIYAEAERHIYGACASPDGHYVLFTRSQDDLGQVKSIEMAIIRWPQSDSKAEPSAASVSRVDLGSGWEPHWTSHEMHGTIK